MGIIFRAKPSEEAIKDAGLLGIRAKKITEVIEEGGVMVQTFYFSTDRETFEIKPVFGDYFEIEKYEWEWIKENFKYKTDEDNSGAIVVKHYYFKPV